VLLGLQSCGSSDLGGTYTATGTISYRPPGGENVELQFPNDKFVVKVLNRHYQHYGYELTVRDCTFTGDGDADHATFNQSKGLCVFDVPKLGRVTMKNGHVRREGPGAYLTVFSSGENGSALVYANRGKRE